MKSLKSVVKKKKVQKQSLQKTSSNPGEEHLSRLRRICLSLPEATEKISHGEPTFFVYKRVFCMFANNHHNDGHIAVWIPTEPEQQTTLLKSSPDKYFYPPYVGGAGWIGIELTRVDDEDLGVHLLESWRLIAAKQKKTKQPGVRKAL
jgi:hypothetical protein